MKNKEIFEKLIEYIESRESIDLLKAEDIAARFQVSPDFVYELARANKIPTVRLNTSVRFDPVAIRKWLNEGGRELMGER